MSGEVSLFGVISGFHEVEPRSSFDAEALMPVKPARSDKNGIYPDINFGSMDAKEGIPCVKTMLLGEDAVLKSGKAGLSIDDLKISRVKPLL